MTTQALKDKAQNITVEAVNLTSLINSTLFLNLRFEVFGNFRKAEVELKTKAVETRFRKQKQLLDSPELKAINKANLKIKEQVYEMCLPGSGLNGLRIVPFENVEKIEVLLKNYEDVALPALVEAFVLKYDEQREQASAELKEQFNAELYPSKAEVRKEFVCAHNFVSFDVPSKLGEISASVFESEKIKKAADLKFATENVIDAMRSAAHVAVQKLAEGLSGESATDGKPKKLFAAHITNLQEFVNNFSIMNKANDTELAADMEKLKLIMDGVNIDTVRENDGFKEKLTADVAEIAKHMASLAETTTGRKFRA